jgi:pimeloyl-ACP methyl ester carboxylesterase
MADLAAQATERTTAATDALLAVAALVVFVLLRGRTPASFGRSVWLAALACMIVASAIGVVAHGLALSDRGRELLWQPLYLALGVTAVADHPLRAVIDLEGQRVSASDRLYLAERLPTLLIWGTADRIIPVEHGRSAVERIPGSRLVEIPGAGHWPQLDDPARFASELARFIESTEPYEFDIEHMREMLRRGPAGADDRQGAEAPAG